MTVNYKLESMWKRAVAFNLKWDRKNHETLGRVRR